MAALPKQTILERHPSSIRMREHDEVGKITKKLKRLKKEHFAKDWDKDLWD